MNGKERKEGWKDGRKEGRAGISLLGRMNGKGRKEGKKEGWKEGRNDGRTSHLWVG